MTNDEARQLVDEGLADLRAAFDLFDTNGDGRLDADELGSALARLGQRTSPAEVRLLISSVSRRDTIGFAEFVRLVEPAPVGLDPEGEVREAFDLLDQDHDGYISGRELRSAVVRTREGTPAEADGIVAAADSDGDGRISFDEFRELMLTGR